MNTQKIAQEALNALTIGDLKSATEKFEEACQLEENQGSIPGENNDLVFLLENIITAKSLAKLEKENPEEFKQLETWVNSNSQLHAEEASLDFLSVEN